MKSMFRTDELLLDKIEELEVIKTTDKTVWYKYTNWQDKECETSERRISTYHKWFNTKAEAKEHLINKINIKIASCYKQIKVWEKRMEAV